MSGEPGSFFTMIEGMPPDLEALGGEDLAAVGPLGLRDPLWYWVDFADVRCAEGDCWEEEALFEAEWVSEEKEGLSWGAGDGAMAMAALILDSRGVEYGKKRRGWECG